MPSYERQQARLYAPGQQRQIINDLRASDITSVESATPNGWRWTSPHVRPSEAMLSGVDAPTAPRDARDTETRPDSPRRRRPQDPQRTAWGKQVAVRDDLWGGRVNKKKK